MPAPPDVIASSQQTRQLWGDGLASAISACRTHGNKAQIAPRDCVSAAVLESCCPCMLVVSAESCAELGGCTAHLAGRLAGAVCLHLLPSRGAAAGSARGQRGI